MTSRFLTHARTMEELRAEFVSDMHRRMALVDARIKALNGRNARLATHLGMIRVELETISDFWSQIDLVHDRKRETKQ